MNNEKSRYNPKKFKGRKTMNWYTIIGIPVVGILMDVIMSPKPVDLSNPNYYINVGMSITVTAMYWFTSMFIVVKLWQKYPWHLEPLKHILIEVPLLLIASAVIAFVSYYAASHSGFEPRMESSGLQIAVIILLVFFLTTLSEAIFFYYQWKENFNKSAILEKENMEARYESLKNQVNPHFLFNSLNTLLSQLDEKSESSKYVHNLSDFLRYSLQNDEMGIKTLGEEISIVNNYCFLQKSRFGDNLKLSVEVPDETKDYTIPKLSLQMLVENAIKHNIISDEKPLHIRIYINGDYIVVENNLQKRYEEGSTKQGLANIRKRYKFLSAKDILVQENNNKFTVELPMLKIKYK
jgi:sensor histidine kinase YesM